MRIESRGSRTLGCLAVTVALLLAGSGLSTFSPPLAAATTPLQRLVNFDAGAGELPESVAVDQRGTIYVSLAPLGHVRAVSPDGGQRVVVRLPVGGGFGALGLAVGPRHELYVAVSTFNPATNGVYRVALDGAFARLPGTEAIGLPNGLAFDPRGNLYVTDSVAGAIWRVPRGSSAQLWLQHPLLEGDNSAPPPVPLGANGIAARYESLLVTNTEKGTVVRVPVGFGGRPGPPSVLAQAPELVGADGLALDIRGRMYVAVNGQSTLVRVSPDSATVATLATAAAGLDSPSAVAFGRGPMDRRTLYVVNFAIGPVFGFPPGAGPSLMALDAGTTGPPVLSW